MQVGRVRPAPRSSGYPPVLRLHGDLTELPEPPLAADEAEPLLLSVVPARRARATSATEERRLLVRVPGRRAGRPGSARRCSTPAGNSAAASASSPTRSPTSTWAGLPAAARRPARGPPRRARDRHRRDRVGQDDDAGDDREPAQPGRRLPHHHRRGAGRVPVPADAELGRHAARGRASTCSPSPTG